MVHLHFDFIVVELIEQVAQLPMCLWHRPIRLSNGSPLLHEVSYLRNSVLANWLVLDVHCPVVKAKQHSPKCHITQHQREPTSRRGPHDLVKRLVFDVHLDEHLPHLELCLEDGASRVTDCIDQ